MPQDVASQRQAITRNVRRSDVILLRKINLSPAKLAKLHGKYNPNDNHCSFAFDSNRAKEALTGFC